MPTQGKKAHMYKADSTFKRVHAALTKVTPAVAAAAATTAMLAIDSWIEGSGRHQQFMLII